MSVTMILCCSQDVDSAYLVKADLEDKVGALTDEINFLRNVYEEVNNGPDAFPVFPLWFPLVSQMKLHLPLASLFCFIS